MDVILIIGNVEVEACLNLRNITCVWSSNKDVFIAETVNGDKLAVKRQEGNYERIKFELKRRHHV